MEQLFDAFGVNVSLLIAQAVNFGILLVVLWLVLYKPVMKVLDERSQKIAKGVQDAEEAEMKLKGADAVASGVVAKADLEASKLVANAREAGNTERAKLIKEAEERSQKIADDANLRAQEATCNMLKESEREIARLAILAAEKAMKKYD
jgi:F-type H+-transporting ATPase subunit b